VNIITVKDYDTMSKMAENIEREMGTNLFYLTSLCSILDLNLYDIMLKESKRIETLGYYSLR
jgi:hypothetical protein